MTRLNLVPVSELMDQHLFAEWREIKMVPGSLSRSIRSIQKKSDSLDAAYAEILKKVPSKFTLNKGHVTFFYDKAAYLKRRYAELTEELLARGYNINLSDGLDTSGVLLSLPDFLCKDYNPTNDDLVIIRQRIQERIDKQPNWYRKTERNFE